MMDRGRSISRGRLVGRGVVDNRSISRGGFIGGGMVNNRGVVENRGISRGVVDNRSISRGGFIGGGLVNNRGVVDNRGISRCRCISRGVVDSVSYRVSNKSMVCHWSMGNSKSMVWYMTSMGDNSSMSMADHMGRNSRG